jgi:hypothetical protein
VQPENLAPVRGGIAYTGGERPGDLEKGKYRTTNCGWIFAGPIGVESGTEKHEREKEKKMRKLMVLAALLAVVALAAIPAIAQVSQESEQEGESGELDQSFTVTSEGDNSTQCVGIQGVGNTGNAQNLTDVLQYGSTADEFEFEEVGSTITVSPESSTTCDQQVNQAASASG